MKLIVFCFLILNALSISPDEYLNEENTLQDQEDDLSHLTEQQRDIIRRIREQDDSLMYKIIPEVDYPDVKLEDGNKGEKKKYQKPNLEEEYIKMDEL